MKSLFDTPMEAECKYRIADVDFTRTAILALPATWVGREEHRDIYLRHPSRNFRETDEALRIRVVDGHPWITYKGPRMAGPIKVRPEIELPLVSNTVEDWLKIWGNLGFTIALTVCKSREIYRLDHNSRSIALMLDSVESLGEFVEIERIVTTPAEMELAQQDIQEVSQRLQLSQIEPRSYLGMLLSLTSAT
jgi:adenylate cyclase class 2